MDLSTGAMFSKGLGSGFVEMPRKLVRDLEGPNPLEERTRTFGKTRAVFSKGQVSPAGRGGTDLSKLFKGRGTDLSTGAVISKGQGSP